VLGKQRTGTGAAHVTFSTSSTRRACTAGYASLLLPRLPLCFVIAHVFLRMIHSQVSGAACANAERVVVVHRQHCIGRAWKKAKQRYVR
jgi:hypothetical protein